MKSRVFILFKSREKLSRGSYQATPSSHPEIYYLQTKSITYILQLSVIKLDAKNVITLNLW